MLNGHGHSCDRNQSDKANLAGQTNDRLLNHVK